MNRFAFFRWDLAWIAQSSLLRSELLELQPDARARRYPLRAVRYWWAIQAIKDECARLGREATIADIGAERGRMKLLSGEDGNRWIGLDGDVSHPALLAANYDELHACDFNVSLPLPDACADIAICLHVFEHLSNPQTAMAEISRILRPGGILLAGTPVAPRLFAKVRERRLRQKHSERLMRYERRIKRGKGMPERPKLHPHINKFWPERWRALCESNGMTVDFLTGAHLLRWSANPLEDYQWWVRLNQLWGAIFPSLGRELYLQARKQTRA